MESLKQLNLAMKYIEANLDSEIDFGKAAQIACCSEYHFRRMFSFLSGISLSEYVRRRRLAQAALEISSSDIKIIDAAIKYGYDSPDSFARAFQSLHGVTPKEARKKGTQLKAVPPMTFQLTIKGGNEMDYRIVEKEAFQVIGLRKKVALKYQGVNPEIAEMWSSLTMDDITELKGLSSTEPRGFISATLNFTGGREEGTEIDHVIGVAALGKEAGRWQTLEVPATAWAVFTVVGKFPDALQETWARIFAEWFTVSGYELSEGPEILWNEQKDTSVPDYKSEIWIPVKKK
ncbi:AraC family transcriptional regulator [Anoxybacterium hadale]|uniref:AraC family transcriptional regulator n=1 Tax=Anoxybacterium hadale TaxID=3408580 RepID=A0ACD1A8M2_9FIRM|nr:AraC family transcriptional regulator [Clostridiales bacterium]